MSRSFERARQPHGPDARAGAGAGAWLPLAVAEEGEMVERCEGMMRAGGMLGAFRRSKGLGVALLLWPSWHAAAAETVLLNESAAQRCYLAALRGADASEAPLCTTALDHQGLAPADRAATLSNRGLLLARSGRFEEALQDHDRAIESAPELASLYINRSNTYTRAQRFDEATADLDRAIELASRPPAPPLAPVDEVPATPPGADPLAGPVVAPVPIPAPDPASQLGAAYYNRALIAQRRGDLEAALDDARRALGYAPDRGAYRRYVTELEALRAAGPAAPPGTPAPPSTN